MKAEPHGTAHAGPPGLPHQHHGPEVVAVLSMQDEPVATAVAGARVAAQRALPLDLVMLADPEHDTAHQMAAVDQALVAARTAFAHLEIRVHLGVADLDAWLVERQSTAAVEALVAGPHAAAELSDRPGPARPGRRPVVVV